nr:MAG TPA: DNA repair protein [Bacteriophage sp.]
MIDFKGFQQLVRFFHRILLYEPTVNFIGGH